MNINDDTPIYIEYLHELMNKSKINKFVKHIRNGVILCAFNNSTTLYTSLSRELNPYANIVLKELQHNFPDCDIKMELNDYCMYNITIKWTTSK